MPLLCARHTKESHLCLLSLSMTSIHTSHLYFHLSSWFIGMKREDRKKWNKIQNSIWIQWITNLIDDEMRNKIPTMAINNLSIFVWIHVETKISRVFWVYCIFISYHPFNDPTLLTTTFLSLSLSLCFYWSDHLMIIQTIETAIGFLLFDWTLKM